MLLKVTSAGGVSFVNLSGSFVYVGDVPAINVNSGKYLVSSSALFILMVLKELEGFPRGRSASVQDRNSAVLRMMPPSGDILIIVDSVMKLIKFSHLRKLEKS